MRKRDKEGRPVAERNAGAFLGPAGMIPVPSAMLGPTPSTDRASGHTRGWAVITATSIWALFAVGFSLVLAATEPSAELHPVTPAHHLIRLMHEDIVGYLLHVVIIIVGIYVGMRRARLSGWSTWAVVTLGTLIGVLVLAAAMTAFGDVGAAATAGAAAMWLATQRR